MIGSSAFPSDEPPLGRINGLPVTLTLILVASHCLALVLSVIFPSEFVPALAFSTTLVLKGELWRMLTYGFANDIRTVSPLWFIVGLAFFYFFGVELEKRLGRLHFGLLYFAIWIVAPLTLLLLAPVGMSMLVGSSVIHLSCFVAFAMLYPGMPILFSLTAKWVAIGYVVIYALQLVAIRYSHGLAALAASVSCAVVLTRFLDGRETLPVLSTVGGWFSAIPGALASMGRRKPKFEVVRESEAEEEVDRLLDKISRRGIGSLTMEEKRRLEAARIALLRREGKG